MTTDWKHPLKRLAIVTGKGLLWLGGHLLAWLVAISRFIALRVIPAVWAWLRGTVLPVLRRLYQQLPHRRVVVAGVVCVATIVIAVLVMRDPEPLSSVEQVAMPGEIALPAEPVTLAFSPTKAPPGAPIILTGVPLDPGASFEVLIDGGQVPAQWVGDGRIQAHIPVKPGRDGWPLAPDGEQALQVRQAGRIIAKSNGGLQVIELPRAPGTTAKVQQSLETIVAGYERIFEALPVDDEEEMAYRRAVMAVLRGLVSDGDKSLAAVLAGNSPWLEGAPLDLELTDALLASSGVAGHLQAKASVFQPRTGADMSMAMPAAGAAFLMMSFPSIRSAATGPQCRKGGKDFDLACRMQAHGLITDLSQVAIKPTADAYADSVGLALGLFGLDGEFEAATKKALAVHQVVSALLSVVNLVMEKVAPSLLPSVLSKFELKTTTALIRRGEMTRSKLMVEARNQPQTITVNDVIDLVKSILGLPKLSAPFQAKVTQVAFYVVDLYMTALRKLDVVVPKASDGVNPGLFVMPPRQWGPLEVTSSDLVSLFSYDEQVLASREKDMEWLGSRAGMATVRMMPRGPGDRSKVLQDNTLCWGCVWSGGAFGTEMPHSSKTIAVDIALSANPPHGYPPLEVDLEWKMTPAEDDAPIPCTVDFGDGSSSERIADCSKTTSIRHAYLHTSRLEAKTGGAFVPILRLDGNGAEGKTEVFTEWTFRGSPQSGKAPLDARFTWDIPWPEDRKAPACEFDPGDGSDRQRFDDCLATTDAKHRFERRGSFAPSLTLIHGEAKDTKTAPVSVADDVACDGLLEHKAWTGTVSYQHERDAWHSRATYHVKYSHNIRLGADLRERTRRQHRGADHLVQYYSPEPQGTAGVTYSRHDYSGTSLSFMDTFTGNGSLKRQQPDMAEEGSSLSLTVKADCSYAFHLQGEVAGSGEQWRWSEGASTYQGHRWINAVWGEGIVDSSTSISGFARFRVLSREQIEDNSRETTNWVSEGGSVVSALGSDNLGTVSVQWHFEAVD